MRPSTPSERFRQYRPLIIIGILALAGIILLDRVANTPKEGAQPAPAQTIISDTNTPLQTSTTQQTPDADRDLEHPPLPTIEETPTSKARATTQTVLAESDQLLAAVATNATPPVTVDPWLASILSDAPIACPQKRPVRVAFEDPWWRVATPCGSLTAKQLADGSILWTDAQFTQIPNRLPEPVQTVAGT